MRDFASFHVKTHHDVGNFDPRRTPPPSCCVVWWYGDGPGESVFVYRVPRGQRREFRSLLVAHARLANGERTRIEGQWPKYVAMREV